MAIPLMTAFVRIRPDFTGFKAETEAGTAKAAAGAEKSGKAAGKGFGGAFKKYSNLAMVGLGVAAFEAVKKTLTDARALGLAPLKVAVKNAGDQWGVFERQLTPVQKRMAALGFSNADVNHGLDRLITSTDNTKLSLQAMATAADYARFKHISLEDASIGLGRAAVGSARALKDVGISTSDLPKHFSSTGTATSRLNTVLGLVNKKLGGESQAYAKTYGGRLDILKAQTTNLSAQFGTKLLPVLSLVAGGLVKLTSTTAGTYALVAAVGALAAAFVGAKIAVILFGSAGKAALIGSGIGLALLAIGVATLLIIQHWKSISKVASQVWGHVVNVFKGVYEWIAHYWPLLAIILTGGMAAPAVLIIKHWRDIAHVATQTWATVTKAFFAAYHFLMPAFRVIGKVAAAIWIPVRVAAQIAFDILSGLVLLWWYLVRKTFGAVASLATLIFEHVIVPAAKAAFGIISAAARGWWRIIRPILILFRDLGTAVFDFVRDRAKSAFALMTGFLQVWARGVTRIWDAIKTAAKLLWQAVTDRMRAAMGIGKTLIRGLWTVISSVFGFIINGAAKAFGWVPGLGPKLKDAASKFNQFRDDVNKAIRGVNGKTVTVGVKMTAATNPYGRGSLTGRLAEGGPVRGPGGRTDDKAGLYALSNDEWVIRANSAARYGPAAMRAINDGRAVVGYATGGPVGGEPRVIPHNPPIKTIQGTIAPVIEKLAILFAKTMLGGGVAIANFARQFATGQQHPYVWGGTTPRGWDCSGFTGYVYRHFGYNPPRTSEAQYGWVQRTRDQPGAMVFFDSSAGGPPPGHVGISMGGGMMANARGVAYGTVMSRIGPNMGFGIPPGGFRGGGSFGGTVRENQLSQLWMGAGGPAQVAHMAAAIAMAESGGRSRVVNSIGAAGLWQIYGLPFPGDPLDPQTNARMAVSKYRGAGGSFSPWVAFTNGSYRQFMAGGGVITEPTLGIGLRTGQQTIMGERGDETVIPGRPGRASMAGVERRLDRLIAAMEANAGETARGLAGALDGAAGRAANRSRYGTGY